MALAFGGALLLMAGLFLASQAAIPDPRRFALLLVTLLQEGSPAAGWLLAAGGYGHALRRLILARTAGSGGEAGLDARFTGQIALGAATLMLIDWLLGWAGVMNTATVWAASGIGWLLCAGQIIERSRGSTVAPRSAVSPFVLAAMPATGLMLGAACVAPGLLWSSEFAGYDVLGYHLQLPREWMSAGRVVGLEHNAYSYLPNLVEAAYLHLGWWRGSMHQAVYACQLLHTALAIGAAMALADLLRRGGGAGSGAAAGVVYLTMPWTLVTGSMAYNEQAVMLFGVAAMGLAMDPTAADAPPASRAARIARGAGIGFLCGAATLAKLNALGMIALPTALVLLHARSGRACLGSFALAYAAVVLLWMARNALWVGNPLFPMAGPWLGTGHWTADQAARWSAAHGPGSIAAGPASLWNQAVGHLQFGYVGFPVAALGTFVGFTAPALRRLTTAMLLIAAAQIAFWIVFTHQQSRFLIPLLAPMSVLCGVAVIGLWRHALGGKLWIVVLLVHTAIGAGLYLGEAGGAAPLGIDGVALFKRPASDGSFPTPASMINGLYPGAKVYAEGFATPFYLVTPTDYHTVWDRSPLGEVLDQGPSACARWLKDRGYSHVLIDTTMLRLWRSPGNYGYDSRVTPQRLEEMAAAILRPIGQWEGQTLYQVKGH
jgi:hypothetical protein